MLLFDKQQTLFQMQNESKTSLEGLLNLIETEKELSNFMCKKTNRSEWRRDKRRKKVKKRRVSQTDEFSF